MSSAVQTMPTRNNQSRNALVLGIIAFVFAWLVNLPGFASNIGWLSPVAALMAVIAGFRTLGRVNRPQRAQMLIGIVAAMIGVTLFIYFLVSGATGSLKSLGPQTFKDNGIQLTYPGSWQLIDKKQYSPCNNLLINCVVVMQQSDGATIYITKSFIIPSLTFEEADAVFWASFQAGISGASPPEKVNLISQDRITVGSQTASRRIFDVASQSGNSPAHTYFLLVYVIKDWSSYIITAWTFNADSFSNRRPDIDNIINSFTFTS